MFERRTARQRSVVPFAWWLAVSIAAACSSQNASEPSAPSGDTGGASGTTLTGGGGSVGGTGGTTQPATGGASGGGVTGGTGGAGGTGVTGGSGASGGAGSGGTGGAGVTGGSGGSTDGGVAGPDDMVAFGGPVSLKDATWDFKHAAYTLNANNSLASAGTTIATTTFNVKVIENDLVKVTVLPSFGGRILSIVYKPTNQELLYQNSAAMPYGKGMGAFYYDWLMVMGGVFPTFSEAEHGKMWLLPWDATVVTNTADEVAIQLKKTDDIAPAGGLPPQKFKYGRTDLQVTATVHVLRGSAAVGLEVDLTNTRTSQVTYEYWTCTTLAPGSVPGQSAMPLNSEIVAPIDKVYPDPYYPWMKNVEQSTGEAGVYYWKNLADFSKWSAMGIAYAYPNMTRRFWGALNRDLKAGVFRVADQDPTIGLKMWTWGSSSVGIDPNKLSDARPFIELWAGHSTRFFTPAQIGASQKKHWMETYVPTLGMLKFTEVGENAAAYLTYAKTAAGADFQAELFTSLPSRKLQVQLVLEGGAGKTIYDQPWTPDATKSSLVTVSVPTARLPAGANKYTLVLKKTNGTEVLRTSIAYGG